MRRNRYRLHVVSHPDLAAVAETFDPLLDATVDGGVIAYDNAAPKWMFLHYLLSKGFLLHGSNDATIDDSGLAPRPTHAAQRSRRCSRPTTRSGRSSSRR